MNSSRLAVIAVVVVVALGGAATASFYLLGKSNHDGSASSATLPAGCVKPAGGFLVVASDEGFNDSVDHGVPAKSWPILNVTEGQTVNITVCNTDFQSHGLEISHYYDSSIHTIVPGQVIHVSFVASEAGSFRIYCAIFCTIHWAMQSGLLSVAPTN